MNKCYYRIVWENYPSDKTPLNEQNLNKIDVAVDEMDNRIISLDSTKFNKSEANLLVKYIEYDEDTGTFKITHYNGASYTIDTLLEKLAINFDYDYQTQRLIIELSDGTIKYVDLSALITQYEFSDSDTVHFTVSADGNVTVSVKEGSIQEKHLQPNYLADIKVEVAKAEASKTAASTSEANAKASENAAKASENAAAESAENSATSATNAANSANTASSKATEAANSASSASTSATTATNKASAAATSATNAANSASTATNKATSASTSASNAATSATNADTYAKKSQSYAVGGTGTRTGENTDNSKYYYEQAKAISESFAGALRPMGTVTFANLPALENATEGDMYNISDKFTTTDDFKEGSGFVIPSGANVYKTAGDDAKWDILAGTPVTSVNGETGDVSVTPENIGALPLTGGELTGNLIPSGGIEYSGKDCYIAYPDDGYLIGSVVNTGYILILLPEWLTQSANIMVNFIVTLINMESDTSTEYHLSGYLNTVSGWGGCTAFCLGKAGIANSNQSVRFGKSGERFAVTIGEENSLRMYLGVKIHDIVVTHNGNRNFQAWKTGWDVEVTTTGLTTINTTISNTHVAYGCVAGSCTGNAATATKATQDSVGNVIKNTYLNMNTGGTVIGNINVYESTTAPTTTIGTDCSFSGNTVTTRPGSPMNVKYGITIQSQQGNFPCSIDGNSIVHAGNIGNYAPSYETGTCSFTYSGQSSPIMTGIYRKIGSFVFVAAQGGMSQLTENIPAYSSITGMPYSLLSSGSLGNSVVYARLQISPGMYATQDEGYIMKVAGNSFVTQKTLVKGAGQSMYLTMMYITG